MKILNSVKQALSDKNSQTPHSKGSEEKLKNDLSLLRTESNRFIWLWGFYLSVAIPLILGMTKFLSFQDYQQEFNRLTQVGNLTNSFREPVCDFPTTQNSILSSYIGHDQFVKPFENAIQNQIHVLKKDFVDIQLDFKASTFFSSYQNEHCKIKALRENQWFGTSEFKYKHARYLLENKVWELAKPVVYVNQKELISFVENYKGKTIKLCSVSFSEDNQNWTGLLSDTCINPKMTYELFGQVTWESLHVGPLISNFESEFPIINSVWEKYLNLDFYGSSGETHTLHFNGIEFVVSSLFGIKVEATTRTVFLYLLFMACVSLIICIPINNIKHLLKKTQSSVSHTISKVYRYPIALTFVLISFLSFNLLTIFFSYNLEFALVIFISALFLLYFLTFGFNILYFLIGKKFSLLLMIFSILFNFGVLFNLEKWLI